MKHIFSCLMIMVVAILLSSTSYTQTNGDYRSALTGSWVLATTWEVYNGTAWVAATNPPSGSENITVKDTVSVSSTDVTISGYLKVELDGVLTVGETGTVTFSSSSTYEHARNAGTIPMSTWNVGSTAKFTGLTNTAPGNRIQSFSKIIWDNPLQTSNLNMGWHNVTISGDIIINSTGTGRWYFAGPTTGNSGIFTINGNITHNAGNFATHGTSNGNTTIIVNHFGNITSNAGNFSICRGSQSGTGTTTWYLHGNLSLINTETQNSNVTGAKFVFAGEPYRSLTLSNVTYGGGGLPLAVDSSATVMIGSNVIAGNGAFTVNDFGGVWTSHPDGLNGNLTTTGVITLSNMGNYGFDGTVAQVTGVLLPTMVNGFAVANPTGVTLSGNLLVNGKLDLFNGIFSLGGNNFTYGNSATLNYQGSTAQTTSDLEFPTTGGPLNLRVHNSSNVTLHANRTVNGTVNIVKGKLNLNGNILTLGSSAMLVESPINTVTGTSGKITTTRTLTSPNDNIAGLGAMLTSSANLGVTTVERYHNVRSGSGNQSILRTFNISPSNNTGLNATIRFYYDESELNGIQESELVLFNSTDGTNNNWLLSGGTVNTSDNYVELSSLNSFSYLTLGSSVNQIPVELTSFTAIHENGKILLNWSTATETENRGWDIEKQINNTWETIGFVDGAGTSLQPSTYSFIDNQINKTKVSYRLKQIDFNGQVSYSNIVQVDGYSPLTFTLNQNYPNPFNPETIIRFEIPFTSHINLTVYNLLGEKISSVIDEILESGIYTKSFNAFNLTSGIYIYRLTAGEVMLTKSMMLLK
ncbi:MAG: T9SS type A sorting domain-containing protein [Ignavibacteria bacterium]|nr:T9SS type A sorting domain-containing protein [Ignavibacteria bacterium]